jgi:hypothetical protein
MYVISEDVPELAAQLKLTIPPLAVAAKLPGGEVKVTTFASSEITEVPPKVVAVTT